MKKINKNTILVIVLSVIFGFLSGILGYSFINFNGNDLPFFGTIDLTKNPDFEGQIIIEQPRNVILEQDLRLKQIENDLLPTLVNVYYWKSNANILNQTYLSSEILGQGFVLTADGWTVTSKSVINNFSNKYTAIGYQSRQYDFVDFVEDKNTGIIFAKMDADNLPVIKVGQSQRLSTGQTVVVVSQRNKLVLTHIKKIGYDFKTSQSVIQSSESLNKQILLNLDLDRSYNGAVVANLKGEIVGLVDNGRVIMIDYFKNIIDQVLNNQKIVRPVLSINYIDLAQVDGLTSWGDKNALVYGNPWQTSPAFGKLQDGDLVKKIDDIEINVYQSLSEILNGYKSGDQLEFLIQRKGTEERVDITLD